MAGSAIGIGVSEIFGDAEGSNGGTVPTFSFLQQEDLSYLLQENGSKLIIT